MILFPMWDRLGMASQNHICRSRSNFYSGISVDKLSRQKQYLLRLPAAFSIVATVLFTIPDLITPASQSIYLVFHVSNQKSADDIPFSVHYIGGRIAGNISDKIFTKIMLRIRRNILISSTISYIILQSL